MEDRGWASTSGSCAFTIDAGTNSKPPSWMNRTAVPAKSIRKLHSVPYPFRRDRRLAFLRELKHARNQLLVYPERMVRSVKRDEVLCRMSLDLDNILKVEAFDYLLASGFPTATSRGRDTE